MSEPRQTIINFVNKSKSVRDILKIIDGPNSCRNFLTVCSIDVHSLEQAIRYNEEYKKRSENHDNRTIIKQKTQIELMRKQQDEQERRLLLEQQKRLQLEKANEDFKTQMTNQIQKLSEKQKSNTSKRKRTYTESEDEDEDESEETFSSSSSSKSSIFKSSSSNSRASNSRRIVLTSTHNPPREKKIYTNILAACDFLKITGSEIRTYIQSGKSYNRWIITDNGKYPITTQKSFLKDGNVRKKRVISCGCCGKKGKAKTSCGKSDDHPCFKCNKKYQKRALPISSNEDNGGPDEESEIDGSDDEDDYNYYEDDYNYYEDDYDFEFHSNSLPFSDYERPILSRKSKTTANSQIKKDSDELNKSASD